MSNVRGFVEQMNLKFLDDRPRASTVAFAILDVPVMQRRPLGGGTAPNHGNRVHSARSVTQLIIFP